MTGARSQRLVRGPDKVGCCDDIWKAYDWIRQKKYRANGVSALNTSEAPPS